MARSSFTARFVIRITLSKIIIAAAARFFADPVHGASRSAERRLSVAKSTKITQSQLGAFVCALSYIRYGPFALTSRVTFCDAIANGGISLGAGFDAA